MPIRCNREEPVPFMVYSQRTAFMNLITPDTAEVVTEAVRSSPWPSPLGPEVTVPSSFSHGVPASGPRGAGPSEGPSPKPEVPEPRRCSDALRIGDSAPLTASAPVRAGVSL